MLSITAAGRSAFSEWISIEPDAENISFRSTDLSFADQVPSERLRRFLRQHRLRHERQLEIYEQQAATVMDWGAGPALTLRFGMEYERAILCWFSSLPQLAERPAARKAVRTRR